MKTLIILFLFITTISCTGYEQTLPLKDTKHPFTAKILAVDKIFADNMIGFDSVNTCVYTELVEFMRKNGPDELDTLAIGFYMQNVLACEKGIMINDSLVLDSWFSTYLHKRNDGFNITDLDAFLNASSYGYKCDDFDCITKVALELKYNYYNMRELEQILLSDYIRYIIWKNDLVKSYPGISLYFLSEIALKDAQLQLFFDPSKVIDQFEFIINEYDRHGLCLSIKRKVNMFFIQSILKPRVALKNMEAIDQEVRSLNHDNQIYYYQIYLDVLAVQDTLDKSRIAHIQEKLEVLLPSKVNEDLVSLWINRVSIELDLGDYQQAEYYIDKIEKEYDGKLGFILSSYLHLHKGRISLWKSRMQNNDSELYTALGHYQDFYNGISSKVGKSNTLHYADWHKESLLYLVNIYLELYQATGEEKWLDEANACFSKCKYIITQTQLLQGERMHQWPVEVQRQLDDINVQLDRLEGMDKILSPLNEERYKIYKKHVVYDKRVEEVDTINYLAAELEEDNFLLMDSTLQIVEYLTDASNNFVRVFNADTQYIERIEFSDEMNTKLNHTIRAIQENKEILYSKVLYDSIVSPYLSPDYSKIVFIPDGQLSSLPFEALVTELDANGVPTYLIDDYEVSYTYHLSALREEEETYPLYDIGMFSLTDNITMRDRRKKIMPELHGGWAEVQQCADLASKYDIVLYQGYEANEAALEDVLRRDIAHFATHAASNPDNRLDNYLYVRQDEKMVRYYGYNIPTLDIDAKLAILSACETGTGAYTRGEGVHSISRYLIGEGVPSVMKTLWKVNDNNSGLLLSQFYKSILEGNDLSSAINSAKHKVKELPEYSHPYYWAGYVLDGNPYLRFDLENQ